MYASKFVTTMTVVMPEFRKTLLRVAGNCGTRKRHSKRLHDFTMLALHCYRLTLDQGGNGGGLGG